MVEVVVEITTGVGGSLLEGVGACTVVVGIVSVVPEMVPVPELGAGSPMRAPFSSCAPGPIWMTVASSVSLVEVVCGSVVAAGGEGCVVEREVGGCETGMITRDSVGVSGNMDGVEDVEAMTLLCVSVARVEGKRKAKK